MAENQTDVADTLQEHGQLLVRNERLVGGKKETIILCGSRAPRNPEGKAIYVDWAKSGNIFDRIRSKVTKEIEQEAATFVVTKGQKGGRQQ